MAALATSTAGETAPHPNAACRIVAGDRITVLAETVQRAMGSISCEALAMAAIQESLTEPSASSPPTSPSPSPSPPSAVNNTAGTTSTLLPADGGFVAYLNLESGDCAGDATAEESLVKLGVSRVVVGLRHPLLHARNRTISALRARGMRVDVLPTSDATQGTELGRTYRACLLANESLLVRARRGRPMSVLKYAMTLDGKIATCGGHSAWVSSPESRAKVFTARGESDAVIVGGNTVRRDNPNLTTRREVPQVLDRAGVAVGPHTPARVVLSRTLDLPEEANLWNTGVAPTIVMTQRGARREFQTRLRARGVEVVEFDFLEPGGVVRYLHDRGYLRLFWECGGTLSAPAIQAGVIDRVIAFVAPKIIGGVHAPSPVGDLGFVEMTQAVPISEAEWSISGPDMSLTGYLETSVPSLATLDAELDHMLTSSSSPSSSSSMSSSSSHATVGTSATAMGPEDSTNNNNEHHHHQYYHYNATATSSSHPTSSPVSSRSRTAMPGSRGVAEFYKAVDPWGSLTNFSPHPITVDGTVYQSVEHYYQAQKFATTTTTTTRPTRSSAPSRGEEGTTPTPFFEPTVLDIGVELAPATSDGHEHDEHIAGPPSDLDAVRAAVRVAIEAAQSPEEAARLGRRTALVRPELVRSDWQDEQVKIEVMRVALRAKYTQHASPQAMLLATATGGPDGGPLTIAEGSPHDAFWGRGRDGTGRNQLGRLLEEIRDELRGSGVGAEVDDTGAGARVAA